MLPAENRFRTFGPLLSTVPFRQVFPEGQNSA